MNSKLCAFVIADAHNIGLKVAQTWNIGFYNLAPRCKGDGNDLQRRAYRGSGSAGVGTLEKVVENTKVAFETGRAHRPVMAKTSKFA